VGTFSCRRALFKRIKDSFEVCLGNTHPSVSNSYPDLIAFIHCRDSYGSPRGCKLNGVSREVPQDLGESCKICADNRLLGVQKHYNLQFALIYFRLDDLHSIPQNLVNVVWLELHFDLATSESRYVEQIIYQVRFNLEATLNDFQIRQETFG